MRFHCGISFSWKNIKKFLFPFLLGLLAYFGFNGFSFGFLNAYAYVNTDTSYNVNIPNYEERLKSRNCNGITFYDYINFIIDSVNWSTSKYDLLIKDIPDLSNGGNVSLYLKLKNQTSISNDYNNYYTMWVRGGTINNQYNQFGYNPREWSMTPIGALTFGYVGNSCSSSINPYTDSFTLSLINYIQNGSLINDVYQTEVGYLTIGGTVNFVNHQSLGSTINNNSSYNVSLWWYYSSSKYVYYNQDYSSSSYYYKKVCLVNENKCYLPGDFFDSYYDLHYTNDVPSDDNNYFIGYKNRLNILYSNFLPNDLNNFNINLKFDTNINNINAYNYYQNIDFTNINCYGRINHNNNYYTYEKFSSCTFEIDNDNLDISSDNSLVDFNIYNLEIFDSNNNKITNFSNYDKLFYYINFQYNDDSLDLSVRNLEFNSSFNLLYSDIMRGEIFDSFYDLPIYSKLLFSNTGFSNDLASNVSAKMKKDLFNNSVFLYAQKYNLSTLETQEVNSFIASDSFQNLKVDNSNNIGYMIYNKSDNLNTPLANLKLDLILMRDIVISYNDIASNVFYYVDSNGDIINNTIKIDYSNNLTTDLNDLGGLLPPGPLDSLLNIPFYYSNKVITSLNQKCEPWTFNFVFDKPFTMPCFDTFYEEFPPSVVVFLEVIPCAFILISYFKHLYKKVDRATSLNTSSDDEWGVL